MIADFLSSELNGEPFRFPSALDREYSELIESLQTRLDGFGQRKYSLSDTSIESVAYQFDRYFPAHYFKSYYGLLRMEFDALKNDRDCHLLSWPSVTVMDLGCGSGAASLAALTLLQRYQQYRVAHHAPAQPVRVFLVGLDPNTHMLDLYSRMCSNFSHSLGSDLIQTEEIPFEGEFPQDMRRVLRVRRPENRHSVLVVLSNVIRVLEELYEGGTSSAVELVMRFLTGKKRASGAFGAAEAIAVESLIDEWDVNCISMLGVATSGSDLEPHQWRDGLKNLFQGIGDAVEPHRLATEGVVQASISYRNPAACYWRREQGYTTYGGYRPFYYSHARIVSSEYSEQGQWRGVLDLSNLELAWVRSRRYALTSEVLPDECEVRLFDYHWRDRLLHLRGCMLMEDWKALRVRDLLLFQAPKKPGQTRPKTTARLEEQILSAAVIHRLGTGATHSRSFSHRLCATPIEYLYEHWWSLYRQFLSETRKLAARSNRVVRADVASFYQNIDQKMLLDIIDRELSPEAVIKAALKAMILRDLPSDHREGEGIPQGHIGSGFWANLYLKQLDEAFEQLDGVGYARYADDMVFAIDPKRTPAGIVEKRLLKLLSVLHLEPSQEKTFPQSPQQYRKQTALDQEIDKLAREVSRVRAKLFYLDGEYMRRYSDDRWGFVKAYRDLLGALGVYLSPGWLSRKIEQKSNQTGFIFGLQRLNFPPFPASEEGAVEWAEGFQERNVDWMLRLDKARKRLVDFVTTACRVLDGEKKTDSFLQQMHMTRLKFATNRLCSLDLTPVAEQIAEEVINRPWLIKVPWVCQGLSRCGQQELLLTILRESESPYCRAHALRALGDHMYDSEVRDELWAALMGSDSTTCEKLKASEGILAGDYWQGVDFDICVSLIESEEDPYLQKNYVLILGQAFKEESHNYLEELQMRDPPPIVTDAIQYLLSSGYGTLLSRGEPEILLNYYDKYYPDDESDDKSDESDPSWVPF